MRRGRVTGSPVVRQDADNGDLRLAAGKARFLREAHFHLVAERPLLIAEVIVRKKLSAAAYHAADLLRVAPYQGAGKNTHRAAVVAERPPSSYSSISLAK